MISEKLQVAVVAGGFTDESVISLLSGQMIVDNMDRDRFAPTMVTITKDGWHAHPGGQQVVIDKSNFSAGELVFDLAFIMVHGTPGEDGILQGYFDMIGMPHTTGDVHSMSLTFDKAVCNNYLQSRGYKTAKNLVYQSRDHYSTSEIVAELGLPIFVKPNRGGSSLCTSKVMAKEGLHAAIDSALSIDGEVILEEFMDGTEVTCGVIEHNGKILALPLTEIVAHNEFFDYQAKYEGLSEEITPARISDSDTRIVQGISKSLFTLLRCSGMARVDFIITSEGPKVIEINTVPGCSPESIIPQMLEAKGISKTEFISGVIDAAIARAMNNPRDNR